MNKIKIFKTSTRDIMLIEEKINVWAEEEKVKVIQVSLMDGEEYTTFGSRIENKEVFFIVLYSQVKKNNKKQY